MKSDERGLIRGRRQQRYDHEGATSFQQENYGGGGEYRGELDFGGFSDQDYGSQGYSGQGYGDRSYGDPDFGGQTYSRRTSNDMDDGGAGGGTPYERPSDFGIDRYRGPDNETHRLADQRGVGPRDYRRSDRRVLEDVCEQLQDDDLLDARDIEVSCDGGTVTLTGTVGSREARWHAESVAADARGVVDVVNRLQVKALGVDTDTSGAST